MNASRFSALEQAAICGCALIGFGFGYSILGESRIGHGASVFFRLLGLVIGSIAGALLVKWHRK
jgi:hypothetical protein